MILKLMNHTVTNASMTPKEIVQRFVDALNDQDWRSIELLVAANFVRHSISAGEPGIHSREDLIQFLRGEYITFPDAHEQIADIFGEGEKVAARMRFRGTQRGAMGAYPPTDKILDAEYIAIYRIRGGLIIEAWAEWDNLASLRQLGHVD
jgi:steroid delta-isomerase-like uncharacterized protein